MKIPTQERLRELFEYREDGSVVWRSTGRGRKVGEVAGTVSNKEYRGVSVDGYRTYVHRVIFAMHHGFWPEEVDHKNRNHADNRIENLRAADATLNKCNRDKISGTYKGVSVANRGARGKPWQACLTVDKKTMYLGTFDTEEAAAVAYDLAAYLHYGEFARLNFNFV